MALTRRSNFDDIFANPFDEFRRLQSNMNQLFNDAIFQSTSGTPAEQNKSSLEQWRPRCDVKETDKNIVIHCELPGLKKEDVNVEVHNNHLVISGEKRQQKEETNEKYHRKEMSYGKFERVFPLSDGVDLNAINAQMKDGVLELLVPKPTKSSPSHQVKIH
eukprot:TRINITY_DN4707_c0_g1_i2.p2 TRINITY_DN4707_c0_g1~~TRINITY_DN4707_c0_g1_i2.p2  ORF type:complete len:161 (+),score=47.50 TRINITY_DN4707_c0_g1_i2:95-577(+)